MAIDLDAIRRKLNNLQTQTGKQDALWKPEQGKNQVRIVPYQHNKENPFIEMYFHYDLGGKNYLSPITYGEADPIEEFGQKLRSTGKSDDFQLARKLSPKMRCYVPVIVRGQESEGVKYWGFGKQVYTELLGFISDPDYGDITDVKSGRDVSVEFIPAEGAGSFPKTSIRVKPNQSVATADSNIADKIVNGQKEIFEIFRKNSYADLKVVLEEWLNPSEDEAPAAKSTATTVGVSSSKDIESAFDDLFNE